MYPDDLTTYSLVCAGLGALAVIIIELVWLIARRAIERRRREADRRASRTILHRV